MSLRELFKQAQATLGLEDVERAVTALLTRMMAKHEKDEDDKLTYDEQCWRIIADLNLRLKHAGLPGQYKPTTRNTRKLIKQRIDQDGFALADFYRVNQVKVHHWSKDAKFRDYLRPATLYNSEKFEGYLQSFYAWQVEKEQAARKATQRQHAHAQAAPPAVNDTADPEFQSDFQKRIDQMKQEAVKPFSKRQQQRAEIRDDMHRNINEQ